MQGEKGEARRIRNSLCYSILRQITKPTSEKWFEDWLIVIIKCLTPRYWTSPTVLRMPPHTYWVSPTVLRMPPHTHHGIPPRYSGCLPTVLHIPHGTPDASPRYWTSPTVLTDASPHVLNIPHGTEHPPRYCTHVPWGEIYVGNDTKQKEF